jgi:hypothetical protein
MAAVNRRIRRLCLRVAVDVPVSGAIVGLGILIIIELSLVPGITPPM